MPSTLVSTTCYISQAPYDLRVCIDNNSENISSTTIDESNSIQIQFKSLTNKKIDDTVPETIDFNKLLNIKQIDKSSNESIPSSVIQRFEKDPKSSTESIQLQLSYIDISELFLWTVKRIKIDFEFFICTEIMFIIESILI